MICPKMSPVESGRAAVCIPTCPRGTLRLQGGPGLRHGTVGDSCGVQPRAPEARGRGGRRGPAEPPPGRGLWEGCSGLRSAAWKHRGPGAGARFCL